MISLDFKCDYCGEEDNYSVRVDSGTQGIHVTCNECDNEEVTYY